MGGGKLRPYICFAGDTMTQTPLLTAPTVGKGQRRTGSMRNGVVQGGPGAKR
jgi:hypothetical protein